MITPAFSKKYLSDSELAVLQRNPEYTHWALHKRCPVCDGDGSGPGTYKLFDEEHECPQDDYGHVMIQLAKLYWLHGIPMQYQILEPFGGTEEREEIKTAIDDYVEKYRFFAKTGVGISFSSKRNGTGKTWAATYVLKELVKAGYDGWFAPFYEAANYYKIEDDSERQFKRRKVRESGLLVLDEVIKPISEAQAAFYGEELERLIRPRQDMNFPTIITTNLTPDELEHYYPRVFSLLSAKNLPIEMPGEDARLSQALFERNAGVAMNGESWPIT